MPGLAPPCTLMAMHTDPLAMYRDAVDRQRAAEADVKRWTDARAVAVASMASGGMSLAEIAAELGLSRARAQQLVARGRTVGK